MSNAPSERRMILAEADITGFARTCREMSDREVFEMLDEFYELTGSVVEASGGRIVKFMGDSALIVFPADAAPAAVESLRQLKARTEEWVAAFNPASGLRLKAHVGQVVCGPMGTAADKRFDVIGKAVNELFMMPWDELALSDDLHQLLAETSDNV